MKRKIYQVDAFTSKPFSGNPAGVMPNAKGLSQEQMQMIAKEMKLSETAFVFPGKDNYDFEVRFFTPSEEVDLCGHATIATFSLLKEIGIIKDHKNEFYQKTKAGILEISLLDDGVVMMRQADPSNRKCELPLEELYAAMGIESMDVGIIGVMGKPEIWSTGLSDIILPIKSIDNLKNMNPLMGRLAELSRNLDVVGVHAFALDSNDKLWCRNFAPAYDIPEESATGTSNGALGSCLLSKGWQSDETVSFTAHQGDWMGSPSRIYVEVKGGDNPIVWVGGKAVTVLEGEIKVPVICDHNN